MDFIIELCGNSHLLVGLFRKDLRRRRNVFFKHLKFRFEEIFRALFKFESLKALFCNARDSLVLNPISVGFQTSKSSKNFEKTRNPAENPKTSAFAEFRNRLSQV